MRKYTIPVIAFVVMSLVGFVVGRALREADKEETQWQEEFLSRLDSINSRLDGIQSRLDEISYQFPVAPARYGILCALPMKPGQACTKIEPSVRAEMNQGGTGTHKEVVSGAGTGTGAVVIPGYTVSVGDSGVIQLIEGTGDDGNPKTRPVELIPGK